MADVTVPSTPAALSRVPFVDLAAAHAEVAAGIEGAWFRVHATSSFVGGAEVERFEEAWARECGTRHAVGVASGTDALHLTLRALGVGPGDEVVVPTTTFVATAAAVVLAGATPRFVDVDPRSLLVAPEAVEQAVTRRTAAIIAVHLYGAVPDMGALADVAARAGAALVEDAAQAHGATWRGRPAGSLGVAGCFSFYPTKNLGALGDGGAVTTDDGALARRIRTLSDHGRSPRSRHEHLVPGTNSRLDALQAAVLAAKLPHLAGWTAARRALARRYRDRLAGTPAQPVVEPEGVRSAHHLMVVRVPERDRVREDLAAQGIDTGVHYPVPCHRTPAFRHHSPGPLPVSERAATEILSLPLYPQLDPGLVDRVCEALARSLAEVSAPWA